MQLNLMEAMIFRARFLAFSPKGRDLKPISAVLHLLRRTTAIRCKACLASIRFRSRRDFI